ncbi:unnamed protein product, partial [Ixodes persulcatus]
MNHSLSLSLSLWSETQRVQYLRGVRFVNTGQVRTESSAMAGTYSANRVFCADYLSKHKKKVTMQRNFRSVRDIGVNSLKKILPQETS